MAQLYPRKRHTHHRLLRPIVSAGLVLALACSPALQAQESSVSADTQSREEQRKNYSKAVQNLHAGHTKTYKTLKAGLQDYPLFVYLQYEELKKKLQRLPFAEVDSFLAVYEGQYIADRLRVQWLKVLAAKQRWSDYQQYYRPQLANTSHQCHYLKALYHTGKKDLALESVDTLWLSGESRPKACDTLFELWLKADVDSAELIWQRMALALKAGNTSLARYVSRQLPSQYTDLAARYIDVHRRPALLEKKQLFKSDDTKTREIVYHGLKRLARRDPDLAKTLWEDYQYKKFNVEQRQTFIKSVAFALSRRSDEQALSWIISNDPNGENAILLKVRIRLAMRLNNWQQVYQWVFFLPEEDQQSNRWQYWLARAQDEIGYQPIMPHRQSQAIYKRLATQRDYYGFRSADILEQQYELRDTVHTVSPESLAATANTPGIVRALELYAVKELSSARKEWFYTTRDWNDAQLIAAAKIAQYNEWHQQGILMMVKAKAWDDLKTRFPLAYAEHFHATAEKSDIDVNWLFAVARQESAFAADAKSSAGALGLLQLLPSTGKKTARKLGMRINRYDLLLPKNSIRIGAEYLAGLYRKFGGNRMLASAAYNAGPHRVSQWLKSLKRALPNDVWIETIPYKETRHYVQNVMTYSVIYGYRRGQKESLVGARESHIEGATYNKVLPASRKPG